MHTYFTKSLKQKELILWGAIAALAVIILLFSHLAGYRWLHGTLRVQIQTFLPELLAVVAASLGLLIVFNWEHRRYFAWLAVPSLALAMNALIFYRCRYVGNWGGWSYFWPMVPLSYGLGLYATYLLGVRWRGVILAATVLCGYALGALGYLTAFAGGFLYDRPALPFFSLLCGIFLVVLNFIVARN